MSQPEHQPRRLHRLQITALIFALTFASIIIPLAVWWVGSSTDTDASRTVPETGTVAPEDAGQASPLPPGGTPSTPALPPVQGTAPRTP
ncbi:MAG: hypothetical protein Q8K20_18455 [Gemmobacter sp.]|jgi:hypothetical protein|nr:hypothetical protein [Gemmobacter sp.]